MTNFQLGLLCLATIVVHAIIFNWAWIRENLLRQPAVGIERPEKELSHYQDLIHVLRNSIAAVIGQQAEGDMAVRRLEIEVQQLDILLTQEQGKEQPSPLLLQGLKDIKAALLNTKMEHERNIERLASLRERSFCELQLAIVLLRCYSERRAFGYDCSNEQRLLNDLLARH